MKYLQENLKAIILGLILASGISYAAAAGVFTGPTCAPPNCNTDAPVNVGNVNQAKQAGLGLSSTPSGVTDALNILNLNLATLVVDGIINTDGAQINGGLILRDGSQADGRVLVSDAIGNATWKNLGSITQNCSVNITSNLGLLTANTGNNRTSIKLVNILEPGTYTFTGSGQSQNQGGGGISSYFYSSTLYPSGDIANPTTLTNLPSEIRTYYGLTDTSKPDEVYYSSAGNSIVYAVKRYGQNTPTNWSIPTNTTVTITESKYLYAIVGQASENGFVYITGTKSGCGTLPATSNTNTLKGTLTIATPTTVGTSGTHTTPYTVTVTGAAVGDLAVVALPAAYNDTSTTNVCGATTATVSAANTVKVHFWNSYEGTQCTIPAGTYTVNVFK